MENVYTDMAVECFERGFPRRIDKKEIGSGVFKSTVEVKNEAEETAFGKRRGVYVTFDTKSPYFRSAATEKVLIDGIASSLKKLSRTVMPKKPDEKNGVIMKAPLAAADNDGGGSAVSFGTPVIRQSDRNYGDTAKTSKSASAHRAVLVVGLGNEGMTADSLGPSTTAKLSVAAGEGTGLCTLTPGVRGVTGVESFDVITGVCDKIKPELVILVDTLASSKARRLYSSFQLSTSGIIPGGGVGNRKPALNRESLGAPVIALGVPLVLYARTLAADCFESYSELTGTVIDGKKAGLAMADSLFGDYNLVVTPKEIDFIVNGCAEILSRALVKAFL
ncbi:MAG: GPR endopeptidase [Clostridiales bacterium]|jgi:hypothetical protein|nr:GPR endopeptidase [Clostridiales bacterium]